MGNFLKHIHPLLRRKRNKKDYEDVNYAIIESLRTQLEETESETVKSKIQSSLKYSTGEYLDTFGDWFGVYRKDDEDDEHYRQRIIDYVLLKRGTNNAIIEALRNYLEDYESKISIYEPYTNIFYTNKSMLNGKDHLMGFYYRFAIIDITIGRPFPESIIDIINAFKPAGVTFYLTYDGSYQMSGDGVIDMPSTDFKFDWRTGTDIFNGYCLLSYGHLNLGNRKSGNAIIYDPEQGSFVNIFRTNHSLLNSNDVLSGDPTVGKTYYNTAYRTTAVYTPKRNDYSTTIGQVLGSGVEELDYDFYNLTTVIDKKPAKYDISGNNSIENFYMTLDIYRFYQDNYSKYIQGTTQKEIIRFIKEKTLEPRLTIATRGLLTPGVENAFKISMFNFTTNRWETLKDNELSIDWKINSVKLGNIYDFVSDSGLIFTSMSINTDEPFTFELDYLDLDFVFRQDDVYTIQPFDGSIDWENVTVMSGMVKYFKTASLTRPDILTKPGYQPMQYLRLTDGYDNSINRNLLESSGNYIKNNNYNTVWYYILDKIKENTEVTLTVKAKLGGDVTSVGIYNDNGYVIGLLDKEGNTITIPKEKFDENNIATVTGYWQTQRVINGQTYKPDNNRLFYYTFPKGHTDETEIIWSKLEYGSESTKYQPNPEDIYGANDPNKYIDILPRNKDNVPIQSKDMTLDKDKVGLNLLPNSENLSKSYDYTYGNYNQYYFTDITGAHNYLSKGDYITISFDLQMEKGKYLKVYDTNNNYDFMFDTHIFRNIGTEKQRVSFTKQLQEANRKSNTWRLDFISSGSGEPGEKFSVSKIKIEKGIKATPYTTNPNDHVQFLDKKIRFNGVYNNVQTISIRNTIPIPKAKLEYSMYGEKYTPLKTLTDIQQGETHTDNIGVDLYGVSYVSYQNITIMSNILLNKVFDEKIGEISQVPSEVLDMPHDFFNTVWTTTDNLNEVDFDGMIIVKDSINGFLDNSNGQVIAMEFLNQVTNYVTTVNTGYIDPIESGAITMGSYLSFNDVYDLPINTTKVDIDTGIKTIKE